MLAVLTHDNSFTEASRQSYQSLEVVVCSAQMKKQDPVPKGLREHVAKLLGDAEAAKPALDLVEFSDASVEPAMYHAFKSTFICKVPGGSVIPYRNAVDVVVASHAVEVSHTWQRSAICRCGHLA